MIEENESINYTFNDISYNIIFKTIDKTESLPESLYIDIHVSNNPLQRFVNDIPFTLLYLTTTFKNNFTSYKSVSILIRELKETIKGNGLRINILKDDADVQYLKLAYDITIPILNKWLEFYITLPRDFKQLKQNFATSFKELLDKKSELEKKLQEQAQLTELIELEKKVKQGEIGLKLLEGKLKGQSEEEFFLRTIELDPKNSKAHNFLGLLLKNKGKFKEAEDYYRKAIEFDKQNSNAYYNLIVLLENKRRYKEAEEFFRKAIELGPQNSNTRYNLGFLLNNQKRIKGGIVL